VSRIDVVAIGNALVDVLSNESHEFLEAHHLVPGAMELIDTTRAEQLYAAMGPAVEISGGSAANTLVGVASLGGSAAFIGRVADDELGAVFGHDIRAAGVDFRAKPAGGGEPSGRCLIVVTPDAQRTMNTYLGVGSLLCPPDLDEATVAGGKVLYMEGYLYDRPAAKEAFRAAAKIAHAHHRQVSLTLSDSFCVDRHRDDFRRLVADEVDILFGNDEELKSLYEVESFGEALAAVRDDCALAAITCGPQGSVIVTAEEVIKVAAEPVERVLDTTGAGDLFASGFLYGHTHGLSLAECGRLGSIAAAEVISHVGARPLVELRTLI